MILLDQEQIVIPWVENQLGIGFGPAKAIGFVLGDMGLVAAAVYHNWIPQYGSLEVSMASTTPRWASKEAIRMMFWYPFRAIGAQRVYTTTAKRNRRAVNFNRRLGMQYEGKGRRALGNDDAVVYSMLCEEWEASKWFVDLGVSDGQGQQFTATG